MEFKLLNTSEEISIVLNFCILAALKTLLKNRLRNDDILENNNKKEDHLFKDFVLEYESYSEILMYKEALKNLISKMKQLKSSLSSKISESEKLKFEFNKKLTENPEQ
ncbi:MAG: hypothetical protein MHPSP_003425, partial [Paramarteilia canceri]